MPNPYLTGALRGADTALGRRADSRAEQRRLEEEQRAQAEQRQAALLLQLRMLSAQSGNDIGPGVCVLAPGTSRRDSRRPAFRCGWVCLRTIKLCQL